MLTTSYFTYRGPGRVGITIGNPRGAPRGYRLYRRLAPTRDMLGIPPEAYIERFHAILDRLDPQEEWETLHRLAGGAEPVLQCFERPPFRRRSWCHRRIVADWFLHTLGQEVPEMGHGLCALWEDAPIPEAYRYRDLCPQKPPPQEPLL